MLLHQRSWLRRLFQKAPRKGFRAPRRPPLTVERLEDRTLLAASITGTVFNDVGGDGTPAGDQGVSGVVVFLDGNGNGTLDSSAVSVAPASAAIGPGGPVGTNFSSGMASLTVANFPSQISDVNVNLNITKTTSGFLQVVLVGPRFDPTTVPDGATLLYLGQGSFNGTFDEQATLSIGQTTASAITGTFRPQQAFTLPSSHIYEGDPNGQWKLVFYGDLTGVTLDSWSLDFTVPEANTQTDANGDYSFTGLAAGNYTVATVLPTAAVRTSPASQAVPVGANGVVGGVDFGLQPAPDLVGISFQVTGTIDWGNTVTVNYAVTNQGGRDAGPFNVELRLSDGSVIDAGDTLLVPLDPSTVAFAGLARGATVMRSAQVTLPGTPGTPPVGFTRLDNAFLGLRIDPANAVVESNEANNSNQGFGADLAVLAQQPDQQLTSDVNAQQFPSLAVDPNDPNHLVLAYMDYSLQPLLATGGRYAGIGVKVSHDAGTTWQTTSIPLPANFSAAAGQPTVQIDGDGRVFVSYMAATFLGTQKPPLIYDPATSARGLQSNNGIFVSQSADGGLTWDTPVPISMQRFDQTQTTSPTGVAAGVRVITPATMSGIALNVGLVIDLGLASEERVTVTGVTLTSFTAKFTKAHAANFTINVPVFYDTLPDLAVDTNQFLPDSTPNPNYGNLYATWTRFYPQGTFPGQSAANLGGSDVLVAVSTDHGAHWTISTRDRGDGVQISVIKDPVFPDATGTLEGQGFVTNSHVTIGPEGDVYISLNGSGRFPVFHSTDAGVTFTSPDFDRGYGYPFGQAQDPVTANFNNVGSNFRTLAVRSIKADPTRPGVVYAVEFYPVRTVGGTLIDTAQINFARSDDYGATWQTVFTKNVDLSNFPSQFLARYRAVVNDDDGGRDLAFDPTLEDEVIAAQVLPQMTVDAQGNITLIWYDSRRDPNNSKLDVFGAVSTDGGMSFSPNYRVSDASFSAPSSTSLSTGSFKDALGNIDSYFGDLIGLASANGTAYAAWTGTLAGNQDIYFARYSVIPAPLPLDDRFEVNDTAATDINIGQVVGRRVLPALVTGTGDEDWFQVQAGATGDLFASVSAATGGQNLHLELYNQAGTTLLATGTDLLDGNGQVIGKQLSRPSAPNDSYLVRVFGGSDPIDYSMEIRSQTADLGTSVSNTINDTLPASGKMIYAVTTGVAGSVSLSVTPSAGRTVSILDAVTKATLASGTTATVAVEQGRALLLQLTGTAGAFSLVYKNFDQYETANGTTLFFPAIGGPSAIATAQLNDDNNDGVIDDNDFPDLIVSSTTGSDTVSVLLGNGNGTFQSPSPSEVGPGLGTDLVRELAVADFNEDGANDMAVPNFAGANVSVLMNHGDGTMQSQQTYDASLLPDSIGFGDFNGDGHKDLVTLERTAGQGSLAVLLGNGDGSFQPPVMTPVDFENIDFPVRVADFDKDGKDDVIVGGANAGQFQFFKGNGDGTFTAGGTFASGEPIVNAQVADINGDGKLDVVTTGANLGMVYYFNGNGDGTFSAAQAFTVLAPQPGDTVGVFGLALVDFTGATAGSAPDGIPDIVVTAQSRTGAAPAQLFVLPGTATGFGPARSLLSNLETAGQITAADFNKDTRVDLAVTDTDGARILFGQAPVIPANTTPANARNLGTVVQHSNPAGAILPGFQDAYFTLTVPTQSMPAPGDQILDFSALFEHVQGGSLQMELLDPANGNAVLAQGTSVRLQAAQGKQLLLHIFGAAGVSGVYSFDIDQVTFTFATTASATYSGADQPGIAINTHVTASSGGVNVGQVVFKVTLGANVITTGSANVDGSGNASTTFTLPGHTNAGSYKIETVYSTAAITTSAANNTGLTVNPAPVTITANPQHKQQGQPDPQLTFQVTSGSVFTGDAFTGGLSRTSGEAVGSYAIQQGSLTLGGNYAITFAGSTLQITPLPVTPVAPTGIIADLFGFLMNAFNFLRTAISGVTVSHISPPSSFFSWSLPVPGWFSANVPAANAGATASNNSQTFSVGTYVPITKPSGPSITNNIGVPGFVSGVANLASSIFGLAVADPKPPKQSSPWNLQTIAPQLPIGNSSFSLGLFGNQKIPTPSLFITLADLFKP